MLPARRFSFSGGVSSGKLRPAIQVLCLALIDDMKSSERMSTFARQSDERAKNRTIFGMKVILVKKKVVGIQLPGLEKLRCYIGLIMSKVA